MMFINCTNHPSEKWSSEQLAAAQNFGDVIDMAFPAIPSTATDAELDSLVDSYVQKIQSLDPNPVVLIQGEMTFVFRLVFRLKELGIRCVAACSERKSVETTDADGNTVKRAVFSFVQFRDY